MMILNAEDIIMDLKFHYSAASQKTWQDDGPLQFSSIQVTLSLTNHRRDCLLMLLYK